MTGICNRTGGFDIPEMKLYLSSYSGELYFSSYIEPVTIAPFNTGIGVLPMEQASRLNRILGINANWLQGTREDLINNLYKSNAITMIMFALPISEGVGHWVTVIGYDPDIDELLFFNPALGQEQSESSLVSDYCSYWNGNCKTLDGLWGMTNDIVKNNHSMVVVEKELILPITQGNVRDHTPSK